MRLGLIAVIWAGGALLGFLPSPGLAQPELARWLAPFGPEAPVSVGYQGEYSPSRPVADQDADLGWGRHQARLFVPLERTDRSEWAFTAHGRLFALDTGAVLPDTGGRLPSELWNLGFGVNHRRRFDNDWIAGGNLSLLTPSDRPYYGWAEMAVLLNGFLRVPAQEENAWVFFLNYSTNREFLPHVPIPGAGYWYSPSRDFSALVGIPLLLADFSPAAWLRFRCFYFPIHTIYVGMEARVLGPLNLFAAFSWENEEYFRAGRADPKDRLFFYEKRLTAGLKCGLGQKLELTLAGGYAFDRFFFEGRDYDDRMENRVEFGDGPFFTLRGDYRF